MTLRNCLSRTLSNDDRLAPRVQSLVVVFTHLIFFYDFLTLTSPTPAATLECNVRARDCDSRVCDYPAHAVRATRLWSDDILIYDAFLKLAELLL